MRRNRCALLSILLFVAMPGSALALEAGHHGALTRPDSHAPIGVMGDHTHDAGEWMLSYRFGRMKMNGNRDGTRDLSADDVLARGYLATPTDMSMEMHMFGLMYAPADWVTLNVMVPYVRMWMNHVNRMDLGFETQSDGIGDVKLFGLFKLFENETHHLHANLGMSFPTGSVTEKDLTPVPMAGFVQTTLPFPMQPGSGTWNVIPGLTYTGEASWISWGAQGMGTIRIDKNHRDWAMGNRADVTAWGAVPFGKWFSTSLRAAYRYQGNYRGNESRPPGPNMIPTADPNLREFQRIDLLGGINVVLPLGKLGEHRLGLEFGGPVYQWLDGPQLKTNWQLVIGWQKAF